MNNSFLVFDTETTGANAKDDYTADDQAAPVQIYMGLYTPPDDMSEWFDIDDNGVLQPGKWLKPCQEINLWVTLPDGMEVHPGALKVHGITADNANKYGMSRSNVCHLMDDMIDVSGTIIAHNIDFDRRIVNAMMYQEGIIDANSGANGIFEGKDLYCTMKNLTSVIKIPNKGRGGYKWPSLAEAYQFFFNRGFDNAHDASADTTACAEIFFVMQYLKQLEDEIPF